MILKTQIFKKTVHRKNRKKSNIFLNKNETCRREQRIGFFLLEE